MIMKSFVLVFFVFFSERHVIVHDKFCLFTKTISVFTLVYITLISWRQFIILYSRNSERSRVTASGRSSMHFPDNLFLDKPFQDNSFQNNVLPNNMFPEELFQTKPIPDKSFKGNENFELDIRNDIFDQKTDSLKYDSDRESCV